MYIIILHYLVVHSYFLFLNWFPYFAGLATSKCDRCPPHRPCPYCCYRGPWSPKILCLCYTSSILRFSNMNWYILHAGYDCSLEENVRIQYLVGSWYGPCWDCNTGSSSFFLLNKLLVNYTF